MLVAAEATGVAEESSEVIEGMSNFGPLDYLMTGAGLLIMSALFILPLFLAVIPANIAQKKGRLFAGYYVFGYFALIPAIIVTLILKPVEKKDDGKKTRSMMEKAGKRK